MSQPFNKMASSSDSSSPSSPDHHHYQQQPHQAQPDHHHQYVNNESPSPTTTPQNGSGDYGFIPRIRASMAGFRDRFNWQQEGRDGGGGGMMPRMRASMAGLRNSMYRGGSYFMPRVRASMAMVRDRMPTTTQGRSTLAVVIIAVIATTVTLCTVAGGVGYHQHIQHQKEMDHAKANARLQMNKMQDAAHNVRSLAKSVLLGVLGAVGVVATPDIVCRSNPSSAMCPYSISRAISDHYREVLSAEYTTGSKEWTFAGTQSRLLAEEYADGLRRDYEKKEREQKAELEREQIRALNDSMTKREEEQKLLKRLEEANAKADMDEADRKKRKIVFDQAMAPRNLEHVGLGYNAFIGNPLATQSGESDPGIRNAIFKVEFNKYFTTSDATLRVPDNMQLQKLESTTMNLDATAQRNSAEYANELNAMVEVSAPGVGSFIAAPFSVSAEFQKVSKQVNEASTMMMSGSAKALVYKVSVQSTNLPEFTDDFSRALTTLPSVYNETTVERFREFFRQFGSHYIETVDFGASFGFQTIMQFSRDVDMNQIEGKVKASVNKMVAQVSAGVGGGQRTETVSEAQTTKTKYYSIGKKFNKNADDWMKDAINEPQPMRLSLVSMHTLLTHEKVVERFSISVDAIQAAIQDMCKWYTLPAPAKPGTNACQGYTDGTPWKPQLPLASYNKDMDEFQPLKTGNVWVTQSCNGGEPMSALAFRFDGTYEDNLGPLANQQFRVGCSDFQGVTTKLPNSQTNAIESSVWKHTHPPRSNGFHQYHLIRESICPGSNMHAIGLRMTRISELKKTGWFSRREWETNRNTLSLGMKLECVTSTLQLSECKWYIHPRHHDLGKTAPNGPREMSKVQCPSNYVITGVRLLSTQKHDDKCIEREQDDNKEQVFGAHEIQCCKALKEVRDIA